MVFRIEWKTQLKRELDQAEAARAGGNEGMARVCARRAAGIIIGEYLLRQGLPVPSQSAYDRLNYLNTLPEAAPEVREIAGHFLLHIDTDHKLPIDADLIAEAHWLADELIFNENKHIR